MRKLFIFLSFTLLICSCNFKKQQSNYRGYSTYSAGIYFKFADLGPKVRRISPGETIELYLNYSRMNDSVFWDSRNLWFPFTILISYDSLSKRTGYEGVLLKLNEGDSINFIVRKDMLFKSGLRTPFPHYLVGDSLLKVNVRVATILDSTQLKAKLEKYHAFAKDKDMQEQLELNRYIMLNKIPDSDQKGSIYLIPMVEGSGPEVSSGSNVSISYRGYFMNYRTFDSIPVNDPMNFTIGDSGQVLSGLETGIKKMREGEVAKIIIPSHSAFGEKGSSTGIVPPYTTLIYEVTMLKVKPTLKK